MLFRAAFVLHFSQFLYARLKVNLSIHVGNCGSTKSFIFVLLKINKYIRKFYDMLKYENYPILKLKTLTTTRNKFTDKKFFKKFTDKKFFKKFTDKKFFKKFTKKFFKKFTDKMFFESLLIRNFSKIY